MTNILKIQYFSKSKSNNEYNYLLVIKHFLHILMIYIKNMIQAKLNWTIVSFLNLQGELKPNYIL